MNPTLDAALRSWPWDPWLSAALAGTLTLYLRGWFVLSRRKPGAWPIHRAISFAGGLLTVWLALASPLEPLAGFLLSAHMAQHLLLMMLAPPLVWLGAPLIPLLAGLPEPVRSVWVLPVLRSNWLRRWSRRLTHPSVALPIYVLLSWIWHAPGLYDWALRSALVHYAQHVCFFATGLLFWFPVVQPFPARSRWSQWLLIPYLFAADVQNTLLAAILTFSPRQLYPYYDEVPRLGGVSALDDQAAAGVLMWVPGSVAFLLPLGWVAIKLLYGAGPAAQRAGRRTTSRRASDRRSVAQWAGAAGQSPALERTQPGHVRRKPARRFDLLRTPVVGTFLRWRHARISAQVVMALVAAAVICDGLVGPQVAPLNLAGVLPWIHWRGLLVFVLLVAGNFFCFACPFTLPRRLARRWLPGGREWPRWLRSKWLAVGLLGLFFWAYDALALWDRPAWTAWLALGYFAAAFAVDAVFRGSAFCKYLCPIGQFNFVQSLVSPLEVAVREPAACASCRTHDCLVGNAEAAGCGLQLFQPRKQGNLDCTFCLDCVHACPQQNVGVLAVVPGRRLWSDRARFGLGRFGRRADWAALVLLLVFAAFANAAGMVTPVVDWQARLQTSLAGGSALLTVTGYYLVALVALPLTLVAIASIVSRRWSGSLLPARRIATRFVFALVPVGCAMWLAHYTFHFLTSFDTAVPAVERFAQDWGWPATDPPRWSRACCRPIADWLLKLELVMLEIGLLGSLYMAYRIAKQTAIEGRNALKAFAPWAVLSLMLFATGAWIVMQPMQMRGTLPADAVPLAQARAEQR